MGRFDPTPPGRVTDPTTGETLTVGQVNDRLMALTDALSASQPELEALLAEQQRVDTQYELRFAAAVQASSARSEDRRKAEATVLMFRERLDDSAEDLATRRAVLGMRVKAMREAHHNVRAQISACQSIASNLRTEASTNGLRP